MQLTDNQRRVRIRDLNDTFRKTHDPTLGHVMLTAGVNALPSDVSAMAIRKVATFDAFDADNDPHGEHDFGSFRAISSFGKSITTTATLNSELRCGVTVTHYLTP
jgi:hypothetical protein